VVSRTRAAPKSLCALDRPPQLASRDCLGEGRLAVDEHDGQVDAVAPLELIVAVDRNAPQAEAEPWRLVLEQLRRARTEPAAGAFVEHDLDRGHRVRRQPLTVKPSCRSLVTSSVETASTTSL
jgi:hypothetical protein